MIRSPQFSHAEVHRFVDCVFGCDLHAKRVLSLSNATLGVIEMASLAVNTIGQGLALARGLTTKHAIKQVDRLLSNEGLDVDAVLQQWVRYVVGSRTSINVAMDWTDFDDDGQATIMLSLLTRHGRATPLMWLTVNKSTLKNHRNEYEYQVLVRLAEALPDDIKVTIVADRGFGEALGYDRYLKSNTSKRRTHSLFRQGCMLYDLIPTMPQPRLLPLIKGFAAILAELPTFREAFGSV
jgi:hypothetical protein